MSRIEANGVIYNCKIHQQDNKKPTLLMLHGFMGDRRVFDHLIKDLATFCNPVTVDLLGHGKSSKPTDSARYQEHNQINDILQIIDTLEIKQLFLFGYSMGGRLALKTALDTPELFDGLLLESTNCGISDSKKRKERQKLDSTWASEIENDFGNFLAEWKELDLFQSPITADKSLVERYRKVQSEQYPPALAASLHGFGTGSMSPVCDSLKSLDLPVLLLAGSADEKYQQINRYLVGQFPNATFSSIKAGHRTHLDNPVSFVQNIERYFDKLT